MVGDDRKEGERKGSKAAQVRRAVTERDSNRLVQSVHLTRLYAIVPCTVTCLMDHSRKCDSPVGLVCFLLA